MILPNHYSRNILRNTASNVLSAKLILRKASDAHISYAVIVDLSFAGIVFHYNLIINRRSATGKNEL